MHDIDNTKEKTLGLEEIFGGGTKTNNFAVEYGSIMDFYLSSQIGDAKDYIDWFHKIRNARQTDIINIHINCPGGNLFTTVQFLQVLRECPAHIIMHVSGACMSAATLIFLQGDEFIINEHSAFLFHNYSGGLIGKGGEMYSNVVHDRKWSEKLFRSHYEGFLTADEISQLMDDKDIWMDAQKVKERLESKNESLESEGKETPPKKKTTKKKATKKKTT